MNRAGGGVGVEAGGCVGVEAGGCVGVVELAPTAICGSLLLPLLLEIPKANPVPPASRRVIITVISRILLVDERCLVFLTA